MTRIADRDRALVLGVYAGLVIVCAVWLAMDRRPPEWDHADHLERAITCATDLAGGDITALLERSSFYPPLVLCAAGALYRLLPSDAFAAQIVVWLFLGLGMVATYLLGRRVADGTVGAVAAVMFATAPFVVFSALRFQLDLPLAAMVALALTVIIHTESFTERGWSLAAGVVCGLGMLTKPTFAVYVAPAVLLGLSRVRSRAAVNAALAGLIATVVSLPWYGPRAVGMLAQVSARSGRLAAEAGHPGAFTWAGLSFYPRWFMPQFGVATVLLFALGVAIAVRHRQGFVIASVVVPFAIVSLIQNKNLRYTLPILPAASVVAALGFTALGGRVRSGVAGAVALVALLQVSVLTFGIPHVPAVHWLPLLWWPASPPTQSDWRHREILALLARESGGAPATVSVVPNYALFSQSTFRYYARRDGLSLRWTHAWDDDPTGVNFMILKTGDQGPTWTAEKPHRIEARLQTDTYLASAFPAIGAFPLPDGSVATVRARRIPPYDAPPGTIANAVEAAVRLRAPAFARDVEALGIGLEWNEEITRGRIRRLVLTARQATLGEFRRRHASALRVKDARLVADDVLVNPGSAVALGRLDLLDARRIVIERATITADDLGSYLQSVRDFQQTTVHFENGVAFVRRRQTGPDISARLRISPAVERPFALAAEDVRIGGVPLPSPLVNWMIRGYDPSWRLASRLPIRVEIGEIVIAEGALHVEHRRERVRR